MGLQLTDNSAQYTDQTTGKWVDIGSGHIIVDGDGKHLQTRGKLQFNNSIIEDNEQENTTIVTPLARMWKHLHTAANHFTVTWDNDEQDNYLLEFYPDGRVSAIIALERRWTFSYE